MDILFLFTFFILNFLDRIFCQKLDVTAFEYSRKIPSIKERKLGHCVSKYEELWPGRYIEKSCTLAPKAGSVRYITKKMNDTRTFEVKNHNDIFVCMGLCDGHASSALGLLNNGDCFAVEIAGKLTFSKKTHIQAYVEYYRSGIDFIQTDGYSPMELRSYYDGNFFLRDRSYGTMEIVILEMRYPKLRQMEALKRSHNNFQYLSSYLDHNIREVGKPSSVKLIRLSTAKEQFEILHYKRKNLEVAVQKIHQYESDIFHIREDIKRGNIKPHLRYGMYPYTQEDKNFVTTASPTETSIADRMFTDQPIYGGCAQGASLRSSDHLEWEEACSVEIKINTTLRRCKRLKKKCKKVSVDKCSDIPIIKKKLKKLKADVHSKRGQWHKLKNSDKISVKDINKETKKLALQLRLILKKIKEIEKPGRTLRNKRKKRIKG